jgi:hypothetical protein
MAIMLSTGMNEVQKQKDLLIMPQSTFETLQNSERSNNTLSDLAENLFRIWGAFLGNSQFQ